MKLKQHLLSKPIRWIGSVHLCSHMTVQRCMKQCYAPNVLAASSKSGTMEPALAQTHSVKTIKTKANSSIGEPNGKQCHHNLQVQHHHCRVQPPAAQTQARSLWSLAKLNSQATATSGKVGHMVKDCRARADTAWGQNRHGFPQVSGGSQLNMVAATGYPA